MLVLSRKKSETIVIAGCVHVMVVEILRDKVRLGVEAPKDVSVHRREVFESIKRDELVLEAIATGEPLHKLEQQMDLADNACRPSESDMITAPRARAMARQVETLNRSIEYLRGENAEQLADIERIRGENAKLRAKLQDKEYVE